MLLTDTKHHGASLRQQSYLCSFTVNFSLVNPLECKGNYTATSNEVGTLAVDGWAVTFGTARRGVGGAAARSGPSSLYQM